MSTLLESLGAAKGNMNAYVGQLTFEVAMDRHNYHVAVPQETPEREGRPSMYCRRCGLRTENKIHQAGK